MIRMYIDNEEVEVTHIKINDNDATVVEYVYKKEIIIQKVQTT